MFCFSTHASSTGVAVGFIGHGYETRCSELMEKKSSDSRRQSGVPRALQGLVDCFVGKTSTRRCSSRCTANASVKTEEKTGARIRRRPYSSDCVHAAHVNGTQTWGKQTFIDLKSFNNILWKLLKIKTCMDNMPSSTSFDSPVTASVDESLTSTHRLVSEDQRQTSAERRPPENAVFKLLFT